VRRLPILIALLAASVLLAACGGEDKKSAPPKGSPENPVVATATPEGSSDKKATRLNEAGQPEDAAAGAKAAEPGYSKLLARQSAKPKERFSPCNLVSKAQAKAITGRAIEDVVEAPQGPTCIYRGKQDQAGYVTLAVQTQPFAAMKNALRRRQAVDVGAQAAYCGTSGRPVLFAQVDEHRVLSVSAPCAIAKRFAKTAIARLDD